MRLDRRGILTAAVLAAAAVAGWLIGRRERGGTASGHGLARAALLRPLAASAPIRAASGGAPVDAPSHLADELNSPKTDIHADLRLLNDIFDAYRSATHGLNPVGENNEVTAALCGKNRLGFAFIPKSCPAINARGELCDRWGTPFFFHALSGTQMEIRSAGPDRKMWTADDQVLTPGLSKPPL